MAAKAEIAIVAKDLFSDTIKKMQASERKFAADLVGLQNKLGELNRTRAAIKIDTDAARKELQKAKKSFEELQDAQSRIDLENAQMNFDMLNESLRLVDKQSKETRRSIDELVGSTSKASHIGSAIEPTSSTQAGGAAHGDGIIASGIPETLKTVLGSQLVSQLGSAAGTYASAAVASSYGTRTAENTSNVISNTIAGVGSGAALGTAIAPGIGTAIGAGAGALMGLISGVISNVGEEKAYKDELFKGSVQDIYANAIANRSETLEAGRALSATRETDLLAFTTMLKGTPGMNPEDAANEFLYGLREFAKETPFGYGDLTAVSKTLLAYGTKQEDILPALEKIGDAGAALKWDKATQTAIATYLGRMKTTNKANMEYLTPLLERGVDVYGYIAESLKPTMGEVTREAVAEMLSKGELSGAGVADTILTYLGEDYKGAMEKFSKSYEGLMSTVADWEEELQNAMGEGFTGKRKGQLEDQIAWYEERGEDLKRAYKLIGEYEAEAVGAQELAWRQSMDKLISQTKGITDGSDLSKALYSAFTDAQISYYNSPEYKGVYDGQMQMLNAIQHDLAQAYEESGYDMGMKLAEEFTKGFDYGLNLSLPQLVATEFLPGINSGSRGYRGSASSFYPHAFGLSSVPYDGYPAILHQGERVLTAGQARASDNGGLNGGSIVITGNHFTVREAEDIDAIAQALYERISDAETAYVY